MTIDDLDTPLIIRYLSGDCTFAEKAQMDAWVAHDPQHQIELDAHRKLLGEMQAVGAESDDPEIVIRRLRALRQAESVTAVPWRGPAIQTNDADRRRHSWLARAGWGSALALMIGAAIIVWRGVDRSVGRQREYATVAGQRRTVLLPDGTQLTLAPASRLQVSRNYGGPDRHVILDGEGYFSVRHDARHPFAVEMRGVVVRDLGTTFDVRGYPEDSGTRVAVVEGIVAVNEATARAGDILMAADGHIAVQHDAAVTRLTAWMQGTLTFDKAPLREVVRDISRMYGVSVTVVDTALLDQRVTATLAGKPLDVVLTVVTGVVGASFERTEQGVVIRTARGSAPPSAVHPAPLTTARAGTMGN